MKHMRLILNLVKINIKVAIQQEMAFRLDFIIKLLNTMLAVGGAVGGVLIIYSKIDNVNGWSLYETLSVTGMFMFIHSLKNLFMGPSLSSISGLGGDLWTGKFDYILLKPIPSRIYISIKSWAPLVLIDMLISIIIIILAIVNNNQEVTLMGTIKFIISISESLIILYSILLILSSVAFWYLGTPLLWIFESFLEIGRYPVTIYPPFFKFLFTWIVPVGFVVTVPAKAIIGKADVVELVIGGIFSIILYMVAVAFYKKSVKRYEGASS